MIRELYRELIPTLGERALPILVARLRRACASDDALLAFGIAEGIVTVDSDDVSQAGMDLVVPLEQPRVQRVGARILKERPTPQALDALWKVHVKQHVDPGQFEWLHEHAWSVYRDTFDALKACVRLDPTWLLKEIADADPTTEPVHDLAYLTAAVGDRGIWMSIKTLLKTKVAAAKGRSLALCIEVFRDEEELDWISKQAHEQGDLQGPAAVKALLRLDPIRALAALADLSRPELYMTRKWHIANLLSSRPEQTRTHLLERIARGESPWDLAMILDGSENLIGGELLGILMDSFTEQLRQCLLTAPGDKVPTPHRQLRFLTSNFDPDLLDQIQQRRGTELERALVEWLTKAGP